MLKYFLEPVVGDLDGYATSSPWTGNDNTPIGQQTNAEPQVSASHFCYSHGYGLVDYFIYNTASTIAYYHEPTSTWRTKSEQGFEQITCDDQIYNTSQMSTTSIQLGMSTTTQTYETVATFGILLAIWILIAAIVAFVVRKFV